MSKPESLKNGIGKNVPRLRTLGEWCQLAEKRAEHLKTAPSLSFGIPRLDSGTHGIPMGKVSILAGRTSEGKTSFALQTALHNASNGIPTAFVSLEDDGTTLAERLMCNQARESVWTFRKGIKRYSDCDLNTNLLVVDQFGYDIDQLTYLIDTCKLKLIFLDYVQMIDLPARKNEYEAISEFCRNIKILAEKKEVSFVLLSQINRSGAKDGAPQLHHLQSCGRLEQIADLVLIMYAPHFYKQPSFDGGMQTCPQDYIEIEVAKNKLGMRKCIAKLRFIGAQYRFTEWGEIDGQVQL